MTEATVEDTAIAWRELAVRSKAAGFFYIPASLGLVCLTPELASKSWALPLSLICFSLVTWWRVSCSLKLEKNSICETTKRRFDTSARVSAFLWSCLIASTVYLSADWQKWFALALTAVFVAGALTSLSPDFSLFSQFTGLALLPPLASLLVGGEKQELVVCCVMLSLGCLVVMMGFVANRNYWRSLLTTRKHLKELADARERLEMVVEGSNLGTFDWLLDRKEIYMDAHLPDILGYDRRAFDPYQGALRDVVVADDLERVREKLVAVLKAPGRAAGELEFRFWSKEKEVRWFLFRGRVVQRFDDGRAVRVAGTYQHITAQKEAELALVEMRDRVEQSEKLKTLGVLAGGVAHDFNNLLMAIHGNLELAEDDGERSECLEHARQATKAAAELCDQLLAYAGKGKFSLTVFNLNEMVGGMSQLLQVSVGRTCDLRLKLGSELPNVKADISQIRQVLLNLLTNAAEAMEGCNGRVELSTSAVEIQTTEQEARHFVCMEVRDQGCGMSNDTIRRIFDPFFTTKFTGRGLGLASVMGIARNHGGDIKVESVEGEGTTFRFLLPVTDELISPLKELPIGPDVVPVTILLVDDDAAILRVSANILSRVGHEVLIAQDGNEALEILSRAGGTVAMVVLDLTMPQKDGYETLLDIRERWPSLPVVLSSGYSADDVMQRAQASVQGFLKKPFSREQLLQAVGQVSQQEVSKS